MARPLFLVLWDRLQKLPVAAQIALAAIPLLLAVFVFYLGRSHRDGTLMVAGAVACILWLAGAGAFLGSPPRGDDA